MSSGAQYAHVAIAYKINVIQKSIYMNTVMVGLYSTWARFVHSCIISSSDSSINIFTMV